MQINRLFEIIYILLEKKSVTAAELAEKFEVSSRTIYRDIETLSQAGIPVYMSKGRGGGISLLPNFILNKAVLTEQEKSDIMSALKAVNAVNFTRSDSALGKLDSMLGSSGADWIEVDFSGWGNTAAETENFSLLKSAVLEKRVVTFMYSSGRLEKTGREVLPLKLLFKGAAWYLYGFCRMRKDYRFFKLRRICGLNVTDERFDLAAPQAVLVAEKPEKTAIIDAAFRIMPEMAFRVYDEFSDFEILQSGEFICRLKMPDINSICDYAASFGEYCRIEEPQEARTELRRRIERMLEKYS